MAGQLEEKWWEKPFDFAEVDRAARVWTQTPYGLQDGNGTDVTLIGTALGLSPLERIRRVDAAARFYERLHGRVD